MNVSLQRSWPALAIGAGVLMPFLGKAYTLDDPVFLLEAMQALRDPLHPATVEVVWTNNRRGEFAHPFLPDARLAGYLLLPLVLARWQEWSAHLLMLLYFGATIVGTAALAARLGLSAWVQQAAPLLTAASPVMLGMAGTVFPDIPAAMFAVWGVERLIAYRDACSNRALWTSGVFLAFACLSRLHLLGLLGLAALWSARQPRRARYPVALALGLAALGLLVMRDPGPLASSLSGGGSWTPEFGRVLPNLIAFGIFASTTTPLFLLAVGRGQRWDPSGLLWLWLLVPVPILAYVHFAAKYFVPVVPALAILAAHRLELSPWRAVVTGISAIAGALLGILILDADARMANAQREAAAALIQTRTATGERVWYAGHWGFHWYAERAGAIPLTIEPPWPVAGDILVSSSADEPRMLCFLPRELLETHGDMRSAGRVMSKRAQAGFYSNYFGPFPLGWAPPDAPPFQVWRVTGAPRGKIDPTLRPHWCGQLLKSGE